MIDYEELEIEGMQHGFTHVAPLDCKTVELMPEVRAMCEQNTCHRYGKCWSCPPGCGNGWTKKARRSGPIWNPC